MIALPAGVQVWLAAGVTDLRKGFDGLSALVQLQLAEDPFSGQLFVFRGRRGDRVKILWWDGDGLCLFAKRLEHGRFVWPRATSGPVHLSAARRESVPTRTRWSSAAAFGLAGAVSCGTWSARPSSCSWGTGARPPQ